MIAKFIDMNIAPQKQRALRALFIVGAFFLGRATKRSHENPRPPQMVEQLRCPPQLPIQQTSDYEYKITLQFFDEFSSALGLAPIRDATIVPVGHGLAGVTFEDIKPDSAFARLGFQIGDHIVSINGRDVSVEQTVPIYASIRNTWAIEVAVLRRSQILKLKYRIVANLETAT